ncbi:phytoene/squalene synthase family protein [Myxococcota bacterium]|nr:phytoene/squalene synthase family protein [Myxococcota bacterium]
MAPRALLDADVAACEALLAAGSKSFHAASRLLPGRLYAPVVSLYAFCRVADDAVDLAPEPAAGVAAVGAMLDRVYAERPADDAVERAFTRLVHGVGIPRGLPEALVDGFAWDAAGRTYETISDVRAYAARVASAVGVMMTLIMGTRDRQTLARACDLGLGMQLTNIARDVGEDARMGRVYLPAAWLREAGVEPADVLRRDAPRFEPALGAVVLRLLDAADEHYRLAELGVPGLPADCRPAIRAAGSIYADIGRVIRRRGGNSVDRRAHTSALRKLWLLLCARLAPDEVEAGDVPPPAQEIRFLLDAVSSWPPRSPVLAAGPVS